MRMYFATNNKDHHNSHGKSKSSLLFSKLKRMQAMQSLTHIPELKPVKQHRLSEEIERITQDHLKFDLIDDFNSNVWELICSDGEMKVYRRELEENGIVLDPLKATHTVKVTFYSILTTISTFRLYSNRLI